MVGLAFANGSAVSVTGITVTGAGATWALVANTDTGDILGTGTDRTMLFAANGLSSGSQTITASWTNGSACAMGVITASGVDQTTPAINGKQQTNSSAASDVITITSAVGDLAVDVIGSGGVPSVGGGDAAQTSRWAQTLTGFISAAGSTDAIISGATASLGWTQGAALVIAHSGADFKAATGAVAAAAQILEAPYRGMEVVGKPIVADWRWQG